MAYSCEVLFTESRPGRRFRQSWPVEPVGGPVREARQIQERTEMAQHGKPAGPPEAVDRGIGGGKRILGLPPLKVLFALEYVLQGLANPFQGITYQPFFRHFRNHYGLSESATQNMFSQSYLAWSFKPIIGFFMDAFGKTRAALILLLLSGAALFILTPFFDRSAVVFFWIMFGLSVLFAATDVAVDRATVISGEEESRRTGRSKAATVGLNQSICWAAIYGTGIFAAASGGYIADHVPLRSLLIGLAAVPLLVFVVVLRLPKDRAPSIPVKESVSNFWNGLNTGPILWIVVFYFFFHFQPALGALWNNYLISEIGFTQTQIGYADGAAYAGLFVGVLFFAAVGVRWLDRFGLRTVFRILIVIGMGTLLTQNLMVEPTFTRVTRGMEAVLPWADSGTVRLITYATYSFVNAVVTAFVRMSTFSLVGAVIPVNAAGSLFAGFMSVANLAYSFSYSSGSWLYDNGLNLPVLRWIEGALFGLSSASGDKMSMRLLILLGALAYLLSFAAVHMLPNRRQTRLSADEEEPAAGPELHGRLGRATLRRVNIGALTFGAALLAGYAIGLHGDVIAGAILSFFAATLLRKVYLDHRAGRVRPGDRSPR